MLRTSRWRDMVVGVFSDLGGSGQVAAASDGQRAEDKCTSCRARPGTRVRTSLGRIVDPPHSKPSAISKTQTTYMNCPDAIARKVHTTFENTQFHVPSEQWTVLASFVLVSTSSLEVKVISLATGSRCLPAERISGHGDALHDCHAEVLARRGAVKWFLHQVSEYAKTSYSPWLRKSTTGLLELEADTEMYLYVSTLPCEYVRLSLPPSNPLTRARRRRCFHSIPCVSPR
jgi:hypothetical protein